MINLILKGQKVRIAIMAILLGGACFSTYYFHAVLGTGTVFTHFFYIPIILAALWWKRKGLFITVFLAVVLILSHIILRPDLLTANDYFRVLMFIVVSIVTVMLTERIAKTGETLRASEERLSSFMQSATDGFFLYDSELNLVEANEPGLKILGQKKEEMIGKNMLVIAPNIKATGRYDRYMEVIKTGKPFFIDDVVPHPKFGNIHLAVRASKVGDGLGIAITDITERRRVEEALRRSEEKYSTLVERGNDGIIIVQDGVLTFVNSKMIEMTGFSLEEALGKSFVDFVCPEYKELVVDRYRKRISGEGIPSKYEIEILAKDGRKISVEISASMIEHDGRLADMAIIRNITERKQMEEQLIVTDRLASVGELASGIAHELNNPLTGVIGFSQLLLDKDVPDDVKLDLKTIYSEAQRAAQVVKGLLTFAQRHPPVKQLVNINTIIEKLLELRAYEQRVSNIQVNTQFAPDLPEVMADYFQLQQVFLNIIINAEHFMIEAHGKGTLTIATGKVGDIIKASFTDDGPGISREDLGHVFDPFFTTKKVGKGTGLGLSICHGIITEHGGRIYTESELGKGATFIVELPITEH